MNSRLFRSILVGGLTAALLPVLGAETAPANALAAPSAPSPVKLVRPLIPAEHLTPGTTLTFVVQARVTRDGSVSAVEVVRSPDAFLNEAVAEAVGQWTFKPATMSGRPVDVTVQIPVRVNHPATMVAFR